jgi:hypothetical protein
MFDLLKYGSKSKIIKLGQNPLKDVDSSVHKDVTEGR